MATKPKSSMIRPLVENIRKALSSLPSKAEKEELEVGCTALIEFLAELKNNIASIPSTEEVTSIRQQLQRMEDFINKAESDPVLRTALGLQKPAAKKRVSYMVTEDDRHKARKALDAFDSMQLDEIRRRLGNEEMYTIRELRAIATELGIRSIQRLSRIDLVHRIATKIANFRGYQSLGGINAATE